MKRWIQEGNGTVCGNVRLHNSWCSQCVSLWSGRARMRTYMKTSRTTRSIVFCERARCLKLDLRWGNAVSDYVRVLFHGGRVFLSFSPSYLSASHGKCDITIDAKRIHEKNTINWHFRKWRLRSVYLYLRMRSRCVKKFALTLYNLSFWYHTSSSSSGAWNVASMWRSSRDRDRILRRDTISAGVAGSGNSSGSTL